MCLRGDDPTTTDNYDHTIEVSRRGAVVASSVWRQLANQLTTALGCVDDGGTHQVTFGNTAASALSGTATLWFNGQTTSTTLNVDGSAATTDDCKLVKHCFLLTCHTHNLPALFHASHLHERGLVWCCRPLARS